MREAHLQAEGVLPRMILRGRTHRRSTRRRHLWLTVAGLGLPG